jgi:hypothetical protein
MPSLKDPIDLKYKYAATPYISLRLQQKVLPFINKLGVLPVCQIEKLLAFELLVSWGVPYSQFSLILLLIIPINVNQVQSADSIADNEHDLGWKITRGRTRWVGLRACNSVIKSMIC